MNEIFQVLWDNRWIDVVTRARSREGMKRAYRKMCREAGVGPPYGMRIVTVHFEHLGRLANPKTETKK